MSDTPKPTGLELIFYAGVVILVGTAYKLMGSNKKPKSAVLQKDVVAAE